ncbi:MULTISPECIES: FKBP-type peptidyl-prolyl cis-trans isomerase [Photobacterium]|uniref:Peptidyl-prolyl cis-trans isomerase n=1 Tax=Photobacterium ganghwense TaxID=320778 RepID=A0A0J1K8Y8_9GAMM|nr:MULTISPECIES: FKBP-type peptidyl-prolyl cis-trans isomerase [Photobacterium]KLV10812.1 peptidylprolyl isomerase [Photobacterium ganghwense]PSU11014.1 FKBP-type peptidyl-prolyl cis-trans isomerase [Photobacterium ganghwense]
MFKIIITIAIIGLVIFFMQRTYSNKQAAAENVTIGEAFLAENQTKEGVKTTDSGLQYLVLKEGTGTVHPKATDKVTVHYHGTLIDGTVFDSSVERGETIQFGLNQVIKGWTEGLQLMVEGEKARFFIPADLAYGNRAIGKIPAGSVLIFDVELFKIN